MAQSLANPRIAGVEITNPGRVVYPNHGFTKLDVVRYYATVSRYVLPYLKGRPVTLKRYPDTTVGPVFYEKDAPEFAPEWVKTFAVARRGGEGEIRYVVIGDERTLVWAASVGTLEIHPFLAREPDIEAPDEIVFDLDPGEGVNIIACARLALLLKELLTQLQLQCFVKVSGSAGLQVYVPLNTPATYGVTQPFAKAIAELLHVQHPELIVAEMQRSERKGRVFIDWSQNADYKTTVGVYSLRAKRHRPFVSLPATWEQLAQAADADDSSLLYWYAWEALERLEKVGDLWAPALKLKQRVPERFVEQIGGKATPPPFAARSMGHPGSSSRSKMNSETRSGAGVKKAAKRDELPRSSAQGGRRRFLVRAAGKAEELAVERDEDWRCWSVERGLPGARGKTVMRESSFCIADEEFDLILRGVHHGVFPSGVLDVGTYELIEGNLSGDYAHLYFTGRKLKRDLFVIRSGGEWLASRGFMEMPLVNRGGRAA
jgi:bifunctional non-homologous end joining protein LigD